MTRTALTIAGSDPSGGAGIQSDLRTFSAFGVAGLSAITALTVQNSLGVQAVHPVKADVLAAQLSAVLEDTQPGAVKIGMLGGAEQVQAVADALRRFRPPNIVLDPVFASSGGVPLLDAAGRQLLVMELMPLCDLVTPNLAEAARLVGFPVHDPETMRAAAQRLLELGARAVLVKGGHLPSAPQDLLLHGNGSFAEYLRQRISTEHSHGTGCLLSSAIAAALACGEELSHAVHSAKTAVTEALAHPIILGKGRGYPDVAEAMRVAGTVSSRPHTERMALFHGLYVLTDPNLRPDRNAEQVVTAALAGGARVIQLRDKRLPTPELVALARLLRQRVQAAGGLFIVNDRVDVALASEADGVHLGPDDLSPADTRRLLGPDKLVGVSTGTVEEAEAAAPYASYFGVGAVFGTRTKSDAGDPIGVGRVREIKAAFPSMPIVAIGGITADNIAEVSQAGAEAAAVVSAVVGAIDVETATRNLITLFMRSRNLASIYENGIHSLA